MWTYGGLQDVPGGWLRGVRDCENHQGVEELPKGYVEHFPTLEVREPRQEEQVQHHVAEGEAPHLRPPFLLWAAAVREVAREGGQEGGAIYSVGLCHQEECITEPEEESSSGRHLEYEDSNPEHLQEDSRGWVIISNPNLYLLDK